jgi:hypothetical protein
MMVSAVRVQLCSQEVSNRIVRLSFQYPVLLYIQVAKPQHITNTLLYSMTFEYDRLWARG